MGIDGGDQLWMSRYILVRLAELYNIDVSLPSTPSAFFPSFLASHQLQSFDTHHTHGAGDFRPQARPRRLERRRRPH